MATDAARFYTQHNIYVHVHMHSVLSIFIKLSIGLFSLHLIQIIERVHDECFVLENCIGRVFRSKQTFNFV
jgi:hypothetical protein